MKIILCLISFILLTFNGNAESIKEVKKNWVETDDRSISSPYLSMDDTFIYIYSEKQLDNLYITITDCYRRMVWFEIVNIQGGTDYPVSIAIFPAGEYYISITQEEKYLLGEFTK